ncbi:hypothetical protein D0T53_09075 [Dysgonomonas sp. 216]|uniref:DUF5606 family protein n=1 Tax=Dysgonomonas sp. 216 TaxID=2302934 RepID=UPI0013D6CCA6|nr:DUF5606 domain-containing protein [Dysgonomonas sp. 216]NDW19063.1 hypothetical protein [Dysgonomonas sp. 216]
MLKTILSVTGKPGLYKLISSAKSMVIVESLLDNKRMPIYARDKVVSLGDIAMYTDEGEVALKDVFISMKKKENGAKASVAPKAKPEELRAYLAEVLPTFDRERIYNADIKKLISWYNTLIENNIDFETEDAKDEAAESVEAKTEAPAAEEVKAEKKTKAKASEKKTTKAAKKTDE